MTDIARLATIQEYFKSGATRSYSFRKEQLVNFKNVLIRNEKEIYDALYADLKKIPEESWFTENGLLIQEINYMLKRLKGWMKPIKKGANLVNFPSSGYLYPSPLGVVLVIGPWNFPLMLALLPLVGAVAAGNCVVLKPSEHAPATVDVLKKIIKEAFDEKHVMLVEGKGSEIVPAMMNNFRFDHVFYTGSIPVGKIIYQLAAKEMVPVTLELGGKGPCIVEKDASLKVAAKRIALGKFSNAGQMCVCPDYLLIHADIKDKLIELIRENIKKFYGENTEGAYGYCKIINENRFDKLISYLSQGEVIAGGSHNREQLFIAPAILDNVSLDSPLMQEEIFGPILPVFTFRDKGEALKIIHRNPEPLSFYVFTNSKQKEKEWIEAVQFGAGCVNNTALHFTNPHLPFGGIGQSGIGSYHGKKTFETFTHWKAMMRTPVWFDPSIKYPPLKGRLGLLKRLMR